MAVTAELVHEKPTKNKVRFAEPGHAAQSGKVGMVYLPNDTLAELGNPKRIQLTITAL